MTSRFDVHQKVSETARNETSLPKVSWEQGRVVKVSPSGPWAVHHCAVACIHEYACYARNVAAYAWVVVEQALRFC